MRYKYQILLTLFIISLVSSAILSFASVTELCAIGETQGGCNLVQNSAYASTFGIKNSNYGIIAFAVLSLVTISYLKNPTKLKKQAIYAGAIIGAITAIYFIYLQEFVIDATCKYCMVIDISIILALILILFTWKK